MLMVGIIEEIRLLAKREIVIPGAAEGDWP
jgi:hypothetical protein